MAIRKINYIISTNGISPMTEQNAGFQGEENATEIVYSLDNEFFSEIEKIPGTTKFRVEITDGAGGFYSTSFLTLNNIEKTITLPITGDISSVGGVAYTHLVISKFVSDMEENIIYSFPAKLRFVCTSNNEFAKKEYCMGISGALKTVMEAKEKVEKNAEVIDNFAKSDKTYNPKSDYPQTGKAVAQAIAHFETILEQGNTFVLDSGNPSGKISVDLAVDSLLDPQSKNAVQNDTLTAEFEARDNVDKAIYEEIEIVKKENENFKKELESFKSSIGDAEGWKYIKRTDGTFEMWGSFYKTLSVNDFTFGNGHYYTEIFEQPLPFEIKSGVLTGSVINVFTLVNANLSPSTTTAQFRIGIHKALMTDSSTWVQLHAVGMWK